MSEWPDISDFEAYLSRPNPPIDRQAGEGSDTGSPHPQTQNHPKGVDNFSTLDKLLKPEDKQVGGAHYKGLAIQPMRYSMLNGLNACQHTAIKYVTRYKDKGTPIEDLKKAIHCIELLIQFELEEQEERSTNDQNKNLPNPIPTPVGEGIQPD